MAPKLNDNPLAAYHGLPEDLDIDKINPEFRETLYGLATDVPEYGLWEEPFTLPDGKEIQLVSEPTRRAVEQILALFFSDQKNKIRYSERQIARNIAAMLVGFRSRIAQIEHNQSWQKARSTFEQNNRFWADGNRRAVREGTKQLRHYPDLAYAPFVASTDRQFRGSFPTFPKIVQARLSNPTERLVIPSEVNEQTGRDLVSDLIFDPAWITDRQVENLGFTTPWQQRRGVKKQEKIEYKAEIIPLIKRELQALRLINDGHEHDSDRFGRHRLYASRDGQIIGTTNINSEKPTLYKAPLLDAIRRTEHIDSGSVAETRDLATLVQTILAFDSDIGSRWKKVQNISELDDAKVLLAAEMERFGLSGAMNRHKKEARELLEKAMTLDSTYTREIKKGGKTVRQVTIRIPYTARRGQLYAAIDRLRHRLAGGGRKIPRYNANDRAILKEELGRNEAVPFEKLLQHMEERRAEGSPLLDTRKMTVEQRERVLKNLRIWHNRFTDIWSKKPLLEPFLSFNNLTVAQLRQAEAAVNQPNCTIADLRRPLDRLRGILLLHSAWKQWESLYDRHLGNNRLPIFYKFAEELRAFRRGLLEPSPTGTGEPDLVATAFLAYDTRSEELIATCQTCIELLKQPGGAKKADKIRQEMKHQMRQADIISLFRQYADCGEAVSDAHQNGAN